MPEYPAQVQRQIDEAAAYDAEILASQQVDPAAEVPPAPQPDPAPVQPVTAAPAAAPVEAPPEDATWKARYLTLQGMFNADVPRLNGQVKDLQAQVTQLTADLAVSKATPKTPAATLTTDKDVEAFGSDLVDLIKRQSGDILATAQAGWDAERAKLTAEIASLKPQVNGVAERQATNDRTAYFGELARLVPTYETVNVDEGFKAWLAEVDPMAGVPRNAFLKNAFDRFDAARTATVFNAWIAAQTPSPAPPAKTEAQAQLERQASPGTSKSPAAPSAVDDSTRMWTPAEIDGFYRDMGRGAYRGREAEAAKIEANIDLAAGSGRVTR